MAISNYLFLANAAFSMINDRLMFFVCCFMRSLISIFRSNSVCSFNCNPGGQWPVIRPVLAWLTRSWRGRGARALSSHRAAPRAADGFCYVYTRALAAACPFPDLDHSEDYDFVLAAAAAGHAVLAFADDAPTAVCAHVTHARRPRLEPSQRGVPRAARRIPCCVPRVVACSAAAQTRTGSAATLWTMATFA